MEICRLAQKQKTKLKKKNQKITGIVLVNGPVSVVKALTKRK